LKETRAMESGDILGANKVFLNSIKKKILQSNLLGEMSAKMFYELMNVIQEQVRHESAASENASKGPTGFLNKLIHEYLEWMQFKYASEMLKKESGSDGTSRRNLESQFQQPQHFDREIPILLDLVMNCMKAGEGEADDSSSSVDLESEHIAEAACQNIANVPSDNKPPTVQVLLENAAASSQQSFHSMLDGEGAQCQDEEDAAFRTLMREIDSYQNMEYDYGISDDDFIMDSSNEAPSSKDVAATATEQDKKVKAFSSIYREGSISGLEGDDEHEDD
jgi:hypothetical protein